MEKLLYWNKEYEIFLYKDNYNSFFDGSSLYAKYDDKDTTFFFLSSEVEIMPLKVKELLRILYK